VAGTLVPRVGLQGNLFMDQRLEARNEKLMAALDAINRARGKGAVHFSGCGTGCTDVANRAWSVELGIGSYSAFLTWFASCVRTDTSFFSTVFVNSLMLKSLQAKCLFYASGASFTKLNNGLSRKPYNSVQAFEKLRFLNDLIARFRKTRSR
jgi:hypothetical protein